MSLGIKKSRRKKIKQVLKGDLKEDIEESLSDFVDDLKMHLEKELDKLTYNFEEEVTFDVENKLIEDLRSKFVLIEDVPLIDDT